MFELNFECLTRMFELNVCMLQSLNFGGVGTPYVNTCTAVK